MIRSARWRFRQPRSNSPACCGGPARALGRLQWGQVFWQQWVHRPFVGLLGTVWASPRPQAMAGGGRSPSTAWPARGRGPGRRRPAGRVIPAVLAYNVWPPAGRIEATGRFARTCGTGRWRLRNRAEHEHAPPESLLRALGRLERKSCAAAHERHHHDPLVDDAGAGGDPHGAAPTSQPADLPRRSHARHRAAFVTLVSTRPGFWMTNPRRKPRWPAPAPPPPARHRG